MIKRLASFLGIACICCATAASASDIAPKGGWSVGPITAKAQDGRGYCSMKSTYEGGLALIFARDAQGANSIAIDLPQGKLTTGKQYPLHLSIGPIERDATALAAGTKILVAQMGADDMFYEMLAKKSLLSAKSEAGNFSFGLKGTSKALMALDNCAAAFNSNPRSKQQARGGLPPVFSGLDEGFAAPIVTGGDVVIRVSRPKPVEPLEEFDTDDNSIEVERLRAENHALELENQATQERLRAAELARTQLEAKNLDLQTRSQQETAQQETMVSESKIKNLLVRAQVTDDGSIPQASGDDTYVWQSGGVYGAAEEYPWPEGQGFKAAAENYIASAKDKCDGDFAYTLEAVKKIGASQTAEAEVACIGGKSDAAGALLFVADAGKFIVITHEGPAEQINAALEKRAHVVASLK